MLGTVGARPTSASRVDLQASALAASSWRAPARQFGHQRSWVAGGFVRPLPPNLLYGRRTATTHLAWSGRGVGVGILIHHLPNWRAAVAEIARVLRRDGLLLFEDVPRHTLDTWLSIPSPFTRVRTGSRPTSSLTNWPITDCELSPAPEIRIAGHAFVGAARRVRWLAPRHSRSGEQHSRATSPGDRVLGREDDWPGRCPC